MSPSEFELRAALRDGEGDAPDASSIVRQAEDYRRARRHRTLGGVAAAAVVVGVAVGSGALLWSNDAGSKGGSVAGPAYSTARSSSRTDLHGPVTSDGRLGSDSQRSADKSEPLITAPTANENLQAAACPATFPTLTDDLADPRPTPILPTATRSVEVCGYGTVSDSVAGPTAITLTGDVATSLVRSLDAASPTRPTGMCPQYRTLDVRRYVLIGLDAAGKASDPVLAWVGGNPCELSAYSVNYARYGWEPPAAVADALAKADPNSTTSVPQIGPSGKTIDPEPTHS